VGEADLPVRLGEVLRQGPPVAHAVEMGRLWSGWRSVVGPAIADHVEPTSLRDGVLRVRAESPAWATEVGYMRAEIRRRANAYLGSDVIAEVRVWTGPGRPPAASAAPAPTREPVKPERARPTDPREAFARARAAWLERRREGRSRTPPGPRRDGKNPW
jgi:predicted nucleic acid-binding Zn ribbon protein